MPRNYFSPLPSLNPHALISLCAACKEGDIKEVKNVLRQCAPDIIQDVLAFKHDYPLRLACENGHHQIVKFLLGFYTPETLQDLLYAQDTLGQGDPLSIACQKKHFEIVKELLLAYCQDFNKSTISKENIEEHLKKRLKRLYGIAENVQQRNMRDKPQYLCVESDIFIKALDCLPKILQELRSPKKNAAQIYAQVVFKCDGLYRNQAPEKNNATNSLRFFAIAAQLPMELQMLLCNRGFKLSRNNIPTKETEPAFQEEAFMSL